MTSPALTPASAGAGVSRFMRWPVERFARGLESRLRRKEPIKGPLPDDIDIDVPDALSRLVGHVKGIEQDYAAFCATQHTTNDTERRELANRLLDIGNYAMMAYSGIDGKNSVH